MTDRLQALPHEVRERALSLLARSPDPSAALERLLPVLEARPGLPGDPLLLDRACALAVSSRALIRAVARNPEILEGPRPEWSIPLQARAALVETAGDDLAGNSDLPTAMARLSASMDRIVDQALRTAREQAAARHSAAGEIEFAVIAMGKWGADELNYASDIDLLFVHRSDRENGETARAAALALASNLVSTLSASSFDGPGLIVDADLRPEGATGPLSRSLDGYRGYYANWVEGWERQALIKARFAAGDAALGADFLSLAGAVVWDQGLDSEALRSVRKIKDLAEREASPSDIKRWRGGIRDIEFSVQLLQLVHGRPDPELRLRGTLPALDALSAHGYLDEADRDTLADAYLFLRHLEHRIQLWDLRQSHELPNDEEARSRIARSMGFGGDAVTLLERRLAEVRSLVRHLHERLYFRPILDALVGSPSARLGVDQAALRLEALGFRNPKTASSALEDLTTGLSRRSRVMHQMLPLMLDWLSLSPDPDLGLAQLRVVLAHTPDHSALVTLLQTNPLAGERLCRLLGAGRMLGDLIDRIPEFVPRLADDTLLEDVREGPDALPRLIELLDSRPEYDAKVGTVRRFVRRRLLRVAAREVLAETTVESTGASLAATADAAVRGAVHIATGGMGVGMAVVAMGKWGGRELSFASDLDLIYVSGDDADREQVSATAIELGRILSEPSRHGDAYRLDPDLRPEGKSGPLVRSLESYRRYYREWAEPWEMLALVRARPVAGDTEVGEQFFALLEPILWPDRLSPSFLRGIREVKARVEGERIPAGEDPDFHIKLGRGGMTDIEFLVQLLQLQHGRRHPELRLTGTTAALEVLHTVEVLDRDRYLALVEAYRFLTRLRVRLHLHAGKAVEHLPTDPDSLSRLAASMGFDRSSDLREEYRRHTRRSRRVFEELFFDRS